MERESWRVRRAFVIHVYSCVWAALCDVGDFDLAFCALVLWSKSVCDVSLLVWCVCVECV